MLDRKRNIKMTGGINMAVFAKPVSIVPMLSAENTKKIFSAPAKKDAVERMLRVSAKLKERDTKKK